MTKKDLVQKLNKIWEANGEQRGDIEADHSNADDLLIKYINNEEVTNAYDRIDKWYA